MGPGFPRGASAIGPDTTGFAPVPACVDANRAYSGVSVGVRGEGAETAGACGAGEEGEDTDLVRFRRRTFMAVVLVLLVFVRVQVRERQGGVVH